MPVRLPALPVLPVLRLLPAPRRSGTRRGLGRFFLGLALLARHRLFGIVALGALHDAGGVEEAHHPVRRLRAFGDPGLGLLEVPLQPIGLFLRQQRIEITEPLDETAVAGAAAVGDHDVIERPLLGAGAGHADNERHFQVSFLETLNGVFV